MISKHLPRRIFDITIATKAKALEALGCGCGFLGRTALDEPVLAVRWAHLAEQAGTAQDKVRGALEPAKQMANRQPHNPHRGKVSD